MVEKDPVSKDFRKQVLGYGLTIAEIVYRRPDRQWLLETYVWRDYDLFPNFPALKDFLAFWQQGLDSPTSEDAGTVTDTFHFQITNKGGRQVCSVRVQAPNIQDATTFFRQNWPIIETMARDGLVSRSGDDRTIELAMP